MGTFRDEERRRAIADAEKEKINRNGFHRDQSPASTRTAAESAKTTAQPDPEPAPCDHTTSAGTTAVQYSGNVRERLERSIATDEAEKPIPVMSESAQAWLDYNEEWKRRTGHYPSN